MTKQADPCALTDRGPRKIDGLLTTPERLVAWAEWFDLAPPPLRYTRGRPKTPEYLLLTDALLEWMVLSGGSLDWFVMGDPRGMAVTFRKKELPLVDFRNMMRRFDDVEAGLLLDALREAPGGGEALEAALTIWTAKVQAHRGEKAAASA